MVVAAWVDLGTERLWCNTYSHLIVRLSVTLVIVRILLLEQTREGGCD